jgi:hydroxymethylpyrimidine/phosphomethylpyrimidine kinase
LKCVLTIAASDSSSGAGIQADLAVFRALGVWGVCSVTNVTVQNSRGVLRVNKVSPRIIAAQIDAVVRDYRVAACKIGMLYSPQAVDTCAERIKRREISNVVLDPVISAKNGETLLTPPAIKRMIRNLVGAVSLITPNAHEAETLTGIKVVDTVSAAEAAKALVDMGAGAALVKGGHVEGDPVDVLFDGSDVTEFRGKRLDKTMHGTGCVLSAAIAARLALGDDLRQAICFGKDFVSCAIARSVRLGKGGMDYFVDSQKEDEGGH